MSKPEKPKQPKIFASDALDDLLNLQRQNSGDNWLLSYLDVFVLVVMLMVTLLAISDFTPQEEAPPPIPQISSRVVDPAPVASQADIISGRIVEPDVKSPSLIQPPAVLPQQESVAEMEQRLQRELDNKITQLGLQAAIQLKVSNGFAKFDIQDKVLFSSSTAELTDDGKGLLVRLLPLLKESIGLIMIEGHTDNRPINTRQFPSNWELSAARATSVLHYLTAQALAPERLRAVSYADTQPVADNATAEGREKNRRVNIVIAVLDKPQPSVLE